MRVSVIPRSEYLRGYFGPGMDMSLALWIDVPSPGSRLIHSWDKVQDITEDVESSGSNLRRDECERSQPGAVSMGSRDFTEILLAVIL